MLPYTEQINAGIALLNSKCPGWQDRIDLSKLDMLSGYHCILGQLYGDDDRGLEELGLKYEDEEKYGFNTDGMNSAINVILTHTWRIMILMNAEMQERHDRIIVASPAV